MPKAKRNYLDNEALEASIFKYVMSRKASERCVMAIEDFKKSIDVGNKKSKEFLDKKIKQKIAEDKIFEETRNALAQSFTVLANRITSFKDYLFVDKEDAAQEFVLICFDKLDRFDPDYRGPTGAKTKAFNYLTTCVFHHYSALWRSGRSYAELKAKYLAFYEYFKQENVKIKRSYMQKRDYEFLMTYGKEPYE
jgi:dimeric dUTPase (all-alpha-NTP-PPase superfamily)